MKEHTHAHRKQPHSLKMCGYITNFTHTHTHTHTHTNTILHNIIILYIQDMYDTYARARTHTHTHTHTHTVG